MANLDPGPAPQPGDVVVPNTISNLGPSFPTVRSSNILGGAKTVDTLVERDGILTPFRNEGMLVYVTATQQTFQLQGGITNADWVLVLPAAAVMGFGNTFTFFDPPDLVGVVSSGDVVTINGVGSLERATAATPGLQNAVGVCVTVVSNGTTDYTTQTSGVINSNEPGVSLPTVVGFGPIVAGVEYILSTTPGLVIDVTDTANPAYPDFTPGSGQALVFVGTGISPTLFQLAPEVRLTA